MTKNIRSLYESIDKWFLTTVVWIFWALDLYWRSWVNVVYIWCIRIRVHMHTRRKEYNNQRRDYCVRRVRVNVHCTSTTAVNSCLSPNDEQSQMVPRTEVTASVRMMVASGKNFSGGSRRARQPLAIDFLGRAIQNTTQNWFEGGTKLLPSTIVARIEYCRVLSPSLTIFSRYY